MQVSTTISSSFPRLRRIQTRVSTAIVVCVNAVPAEVDIAQTSQALPREAHDLRKRDASEIIRMIAASEIEGTDRTAGRRLDGSCPDDRRFDDVAPVTNADQGAGHVHMDTERLASRQRGDHVAEPFECGRLIYRHPEARQKTRNTEPDAQSRSDRADAAKRSSSSTELQNTARSWSTAGAVSGHHLPGPLSKIALAGQPFSKARRTSNWLMHSASMPALRASVRYSMSGLVFRLYA